MNIVAKFETSVAVTVAVAAGGTVIDTVDCQSFGNILCFEVENVGTSKAFDAFSIEVLMHDSAEWVTLNSAWTTVGPVLLYFSTALNTLAHSTSGSAIIKLNGVNAVRFRASSNTATTTAKVRGYVLG